MKCTKNDLNRTLRVQLKEAQKIRKRYKVNAEGKTLGRISADIAKKLQGKDKAYYSDFRDVWDFVLVENADKIRVSGKKLMDKMYYNYSGYKGNLKEMNLQTVLKKDPIRVLKEAVRWMLPKNKLRDRRMKRFKIIAWTTTKFDHFKPTNLYND